MDSEGMTRAWPTAPLTSRKIKPTQNQARISRRIFCSVERASSCSLRGFLAFTCHRYDFFADAASARSAFPNFELHEIGRVVARITGSAERTIGVTDGLLQSGERNVTERIRAQETADFLRSVRRG